MSSHLLRRSLSTASAARQGNRVFVVGVGMTKFERPGKRENFDYPMMVKEAGTRALEDAKIDYSQVQQIACGYVSGDSTSGQRAVYELGETGVPVYNVNNNCSTGSTALMLMANMIRGGLADCVLAVGFEKMQMGSLKAGAEDREPPLLRHLNRMAEVGGGHSKAPMAPWLFGAAGVEHMKRFGTTQEDFARVAHKNHKHSVNNPYAQFQKEYTMDEILASPAVFGPLTRLQCSPTSDGAAAAVLVSEQFVKSHGLQDQAVEIIGQAMATDHSDSFNQSASPMTIIGSTMTKKAADMAYKMAGRASH